MITSNPSRLSRIGVFYDGNYFMHVSRYYNYIHERKSRISVSGLHSFIRNRVAENEGLPVNLCQIVDAHYFRGRLSAYEAAQREKQLLFERLFDDVLTNEGVTTHYQPIRTFGTHRSEGNTEVWLALEAFELAIHKRFDVVVLIASDGDYVPLVRKLNTLGTRVMVMSWEFSYVDDQGRDRVSQTSRDLIAEAAFPVFVNEQIDSAPEGTDAVIDALFVPRREERFVPPTPVPRRPEREEVDYNSFNSADANGNGPRKTGTIKALKDSYGFINSYPRDAFFFHTNISNYDFGDLQVGDEVEYTEETTQDGRVVAKDINVVHS